MMYLSGLQLTWPRPPRWSDHESTMPTRASDVSVSKRRPSYSLGTYVEYKPDMAGQRGPSDWLAKAGQSMGQPEA